MVKANGSTLQAYNIRHTALVAKGNYVRSHCNCRSLRLMRRTAVGWSNCSLWLSGTTPQVEDATTVIYLIHYTQTIEAYYARCSRHSRRSKLHFTIRDQRSLSRSILAGV